MAVGGVDQQVMYRRAGVRFIMFLVMFAPTVFVLAQLASLVHGLALAAVSVPTLALVAYRAIQLRLTFDHERVTIHNVLGTTSMPWTDVREIATDVPCGAGPDGVRLVFVRHDGSSAPATVTMWPGRRAGELKAALQHAGRVVVAARPPSNPRWWVKGSDAWRASDDDS